MKQLIIGITVVLAFHVGNVEAAQWMPLDEAEDRPLIRTNNCPEEGRVICTSKPAGDGKGIHKISSLFSSSWFSQVSYIWK